MEDVKDDDVPESEGRPDRTEEEDRGGGLNALERVNVGSTALCAREGEAECEC